MKICVIGNSHSSCVRKALNEFKPRLDCTLTFFSSSGSNILDSSFKGDSLIPHTHLLRESWKLTSGGDEVLNFRDFDAVWIVGYPASFNELARRAIALTKPFSQQFRDAAVIESRPGMRHIANYLSSLDYPVFVTARPNRAVSPRAKSENLGDLYDSYSSHVGEIFSSQGMTFLPQPILTLSSMSTTKLEFSRNGVGLGKEIRNQELESKKGDDDVTHMNEHYGLHLLDMLQHVLRTESSAK